MKKQGLFSLLHPATLFPFSLRESLVFQLKKRAAQSPSTLRRPSPKRRPTMNHTKNGLFITLYRILVKGKKHYATPSVDALIELLTERHDKTIKRRWAFHCLHDLEAWGLITRHCRYIKKPDGSYKQIPSMISITLKGARKLFALGVDGAARLTKEILGWIRAGDKRFPKYENPLNSPTDFRREGGLVYIKKVFSEMPVLGQMKI